MFKKILIVLIVGCFLLGMATKAEVENVKEEAESTEVSADNGELKIELVQKIESVSDYLISKDGKVLLYAPKTTGQTRASDVRMLSITEDAKTKVLSFNKMRNNVDIDPEVLDVPWTKLFKDRVIYMGGKSGYYPDRVITKKLDGTILSEVPCYLENWEPVISLNGKYIAIIPGVINPQYPSIKMYDAGTGKKIWEKFTPSDIEVWDQDNASQVFTAASFIGNDSIVVYFDDTIWLFGVKSGKEYWKRKIFEEPKEHNEQEGSFISTAESGDIIFFSTESPFKNSFLFSIKKDGEVRWEKIEKEIFATELSPNGKFFILLRPDYIDMIDNKKGNMLWRKKGIVSFFGIFYGFDDSFNIVEGKLGKETSNSIHIINSNHGSLYKEFDGKSLRFENDSKILTFKRENELFVYRLSVGKR